MPGGEPNSLESAEFVSPTFGKVSSGEMFSKLVEYIGEMADNAYHLIIGTDSFIGKETLFVSAVVVHRLGHGGRYFYRKLRHKNGEYAPEDILRGDDEHRARLFLKGETSGKRPQGFAGRDTP